MRTTLAPFDECHERFFALDVVRIMEHVFLVPDVAEMLTQISELTGYPRQRARLTLQPLSPARLY